MELPRNARLPPVSKADRGWLYLRSEGFCWSVSATMLEWFNCEEGDLLGHGWTFFIAKESRATLKQLIDAVQGEQPWAEAPITFRTRANKRVVALLRVLEQHDRSYGSKQLIVRCERRESVA